MWIGSHWQLQRFNSILVHTVYIMRNVKYVTVMLIQQWTECNTLLFNPLWEKYTTLWNQFTRLTQRKVHITGCTGFSQSRGNIIGFTQRRGNIIGFTQSRGNVIGLAHSRGHITRYTGFTQTRGKLTYCVNL